MFDNQPTYGDNPTARNREPSNHQGDWWIGGAEHRPNISSAPGLLQPVGPDVPQGTLTSPTFNVIGQTISFLIGGGCDANVVRAELIVGGQAVRNETGQCNETMTRKEWNVKEFIGQSAQLRLVDSSSDSWAHINFDDLKGEISCSV